MAQLRAEIKRGFLRCIFRPTQSDTPVPFIGALEAFQTNGFNAIKSGRLVVGAGGSGHSVTFKTPQIGEQFTQEEVFALSEEFLSIYSDVIAAGLAAADNDAAIFSAMLADDRLQSITTVRQDYTLLNMPSIR